ncbi:hypothetical protein E3U23_07740 [Erythrobacter litoralis]|uniref:XrtV sorting system accessory protein n=1 Tax=Erythrobacter litoralis TaxID=39960 RepID=UPI0024360265|nr:XrtV sorting system accessory protein [Erythrobacter litoralis]MDG6079081.1 hypothetical protein [Erythrobacter litoralis]
METIYDWLTVLIFAGLITLFLQRSSMDEPPDTIWHYMPPAIGCAVANYLGNEEMHVLAAAAIAAVLGYILVILKPFQRA